MARSIVYITLLAAQYTLLFTGTATAVGTNSTSILQALPKENVTFSKNADPYPISSNSTEIENGSNSTNVTLSDQQLNPYWPSSDEYPVWNKSVSVSFSLLSHNNTSLKKRDNPILRIMPLGASITQGFNTAQHPIEAEQNGYRLQLREILRYSGYEVNYIGSKQNGLFADNENEGHPGYVIDQVKGAMDPVLNSEKPNLVLINAGTNDCTLADSTFGGVAYVNGIGQRYQAMLDLIYAESPGVTIIMSTILPNYGGGNIASYVSNGNAQLRSLYQQYKANGAKIVLAEMNAGWWVYPDDFSDTTHPNDYGYSMMASIWFEAFQEVVDAGYLIDPIDTGATGGDAGGTCMPTSSGFGPKFTTMADEFGYNDGDYVHASTLSITDYEPPSLHFNHSALTYNQFHFAEIYKTASDVEALDDLILIMDPADRVFSGDEGDHVFSYFNFLQNTGDGKFATEWVSIDIVGQGTPECLSRGVRFGDINNDGLDDFICLDLDGNMFVSMNNGGTPPTFTYHGQIYSDRFAQGDVRLGDIDGDGRLDYCGLDSDGEMYCHRNGGSGLLPTSAYKGYWQGILLGTTGGPTFGGVTGLDTAGVRLIDINGDGKTDWVWVATDGATKIVINQRGDLSDGPGLKPHWVDVDVGHAGFAGESLADLRPQILFGRVFGSGRMDYIRFSETKTSSTSSTSRYSYTVSMWENKGAGGTKVNGDGVEFCDMTGDGVDDMVFIWGGGMVDVWPRSSSSSDDAPSFSFLAQVAQLGVDRKWVQVADWDGDGRCDLLVTNRATGDVTMYKNTGSGSSITIGAGQTVVSGGKCPQTHTVALTDLAVRFGDLDGDGRTDYLCMDPNGRTVGWLNKASGLTSLSQIKVSVGFDRPNHRWADVNGDGLVDFLWVDKHTGNVEFWANNGFTPSIGSSMNWVGYPSSWIAGKERGQNILFPKLQTGTKRVDYQVTLPISGKGTAYHNLCTGDGGVGPGPDDGAGPVDPGLPVDPYNNGGGGTPTCCSQGTLVSLTSRGFDFAYV